MKIDITIYDDNDNMIMGYYNEQADLDGLIDCAMTLCNIVISEKKRQIDTICDKTQQIVTKRDK